MIEQIARALNLKNKNGSLNTGRARMVYDRYKYILMHGEEIISTGETKDNVIAPQNADQIDIWGNEEAVFDLLNSGQVDGDEDDEEYESDSN